MSGCLVSSKCVTFFFCLRNWKNSWCCRSIKSLDTPCSRKWHWPNDTGLGLLIFLFESSISDSIKIAKPNLPCDKHRTAKYVASCELRASNVRNCLQQRLLQRNANSAVSSLVPSLPWQQVLANPDTKLLIKWTSNYIYMTTTVTGKHFLNFIHKVAQFLVVHGSVHSKIATNLLTIW